MAETPKLALDHVAKSFGGKPVLRDVTLSVGSGESLAIIGGSGSGKSVTLKCILGLIEPDAGTIFVDGENMTAMGASARAEVRAKFGMLFQGGALFDSLPVWRNVTFALTRGRLLRGKEMREVARESLERVHLGPEVLDLHPAELSGGMQKRVALARAIAPKPDIIFFDEPTTGLDPIRASVINELIVELVEGLGVTAVTITHDMVSARRVAHRIAMLYEGEIIWTGPTGELDRCGNPEVERFVKGEAPAA